MFKFKYNYLKEMRQKSLKMRQEVYGKYINIIEPAIKAAGGIIGGPASINMSMDKPRGLDDYRYIVYVRNALKFANDLANTLYKKFGSFVVLKNLVGHCKRFLLFIDLYDILDIRTLNPDYFNAIKPVIKNGFKLMPPEYNLINIYRDLYDPANIDKIEDNLKYESALFKKVKPRHKIIVGAGDLKSNIIDLISGKCVFIGPAAASILMGEEPDWNAPLEVISNDAESLFNNIYNNIDAANVRVKRINLSLLDDTLKRYLLVGRNGPILSIYNSAEYELIPYFDADELKIGTLFVVLRFYMINVWNLMALHKRGIIKNTNTAKYYLNNYNRLRSSYAKIDITDSKILAPVDKFYGYYIDRNLRAKIQNAKIKRMPDYKPGIYKKKYGKFREIKKRMEDI